MKKILLLLLIAPIFSFGQIISQYVETDQGNHPKLIEIYNNTGADIDLSDKNLKIYLSILM